jgi:hypothetical protein
MFSIECNAPPTLVVSRRLYYLQHHFCVPNLAQALSIILSLHIVGALRGLRDKRYDRVAFNIANHGE